MRIRPLRSAVPAAFVLVLVSPGAASTGAAADSTGSTRPAGAATIPDERCDANRDAGEITFLTGFDFAASASGVEIAVAEANGYYDELCLDVQIRPSFSTANYPLVASGEGQFASAGSFSEMVAAATTQDADFVALAVEGRTPIDVLIVKPGIGDQPEDLEGRTIGVKGALPTSVRAMLALAGLIEGEDFDTVLLDGFDPVAHIGLDDIDAFPGYRSNEPGALDRAGVEYELIDPADDGVAGSFGVIYTTRSFIADHPGAAEDFMRASMRGLADAIADPVAAANLAVDNIEANGNPNVLSREGETYRWRTDAASIADATPDGTGYGLPDPDALQDELDTAASVGLFTGDPGDPGDAPDAVDFVDLDLSAALYDDDGTVVWP